MLARPPPDGGEHLYLAWSALLPRLQPKERQKAGDRVRIRPTEVKALVEVLDAEHADVETLATEVIAALDRMRESRKRWCVVVHDGLPSVYGPYDTPTQARKDVGKNIIAHTEGTRGTLCVLRTTDMEVSDE